MKHAIIALFAVLLLTPPCSNALAADRPKPADIEKNPYVLLSRAYAKADDGDAAGAAEDARLAAETAERITGRFSATTATIRMKQAELMEKAGAQPSEYLQNMEISVEILKSRLGPESPDALTAEHSWRTSACAASPDKDTVNAFSDLLARGQKILGDESIEFQWMLRNAASCAMAAGMSDRALDHSYALLSILRRLKNPQNDDILAERLAIFKIEAAKSGNPVPD